MPRALALQSFPPAAGAGYAEGAEEECWVEEGGGAWADEEGETVKEVRE